MELPVENVFRRVQRAGTCPVLLQLMYYTISLILNTRQIHSSFLSLAGTGSS